MMTNEGTLTLEIENSESVRMVQIHGQRIELDVLNGPLKFGAGEHEVEVRRWGFLPQTVPFSIRRGEKTLVTIDHIPRRKSLAGDPRNEIAPAASLVGGPPIHRIPHPSSLVGIRPGQEQSLTSLGMVFCWCPPGTLTMGSPPDEPGRDRDEDQVEVTLAQGFWLARHEVTQEAFRSVMGENPSWFSSAGGSIEKVSGLHTSQLTVEMVSWHEALGFCQRLTEQESNAGRLPLGWSYTLPTEAQWEYACRAGTLTVTAFGDSLGSDQANFNGAFPCRNTVIGDNVARTTVVGSYPPNKWRFHDFHGKVAEWCRDVYVNRLQGGVAPINPSSGAHRVIRGGGWSFMGRDLRSASRQGIPTASKLGDVGFRCALVQE